MYFSNAIVYQVTRDIGLNDMEAIEKFSEKLKEFAFTPCGSQDLKRIGWVPPLRIVDAESMVLAGAGRVLITLKREEKILPAASVNKLLNQKVSEIEAAQDRKVKKKEKDALKEDIVQSLLPRCLTKESVMNGYLSLADKTLVIDSTSDNQANEFMALLRKSIGSLPAVCVQSNTPFDITMTNWLQGQVEPIGFSIGNDAKLSSILNSGKVTLKDEELFSDEVLAHLAADKLVTEIRLQREGTVSFSLNDSFELKRLKWAEELKDQHDDLDVEDIAARMDADFALMAGELDKVVAQLFDVMKVERQLDGVAPTLSAAADEKVDDLYPHAVTFIQETRRCSVSALQRKYKIGYNRAVRIVDNLEQAGLVSAPDHSGAREVLIAYQEAE